jgi:cytochrome c-type protein NapB
MKKLSTKLVLVLSLIGVIASADVKLGACYGCHGTDWSKKALGKSKVVKDMNSTEIATALKGYKAGTYGGAMKGLMKGQIAKYSDADLEKASVAITGGK